MVSLHPRKIVVQNMFLYHEEQNVIHPFQLFKVHIFASFQGFQGFIPYDYPFSRFSRSGSCNSRFSRFSRFSRSGRHPENIYENRWEQNVLLILKFSLFTWSMQKFSTQLKKQFVKKFMTVRWLFSWQSWIFLDQIKFHVFSMISGNSMSYAHPRYILLKFRW